MTVSSVIITGKKLAVVCKEKADSSILGKLLEVLVLLRNAKQMRFRLIIKKGKKKYYHTLPLMVQMSKKCC